MKKRLMSLLLVLVMVFSLMPVSAMAKVYIFEGDAIELDFYRNSGDEKPFNTQRVLANGINAIYDPGCTLGENEYFVGWQIDGEDGVKATIDDVRAYVEANKTTLAGSTDPVVITAVVSPVHYVVYYDENNRVVKTAAVVKALNGDSWNTTVNYDYIPVNVNSEFDGWKDVNNNTYQNGATIAAGSDSDANDVELRPIVKTGYWVTFDENDHKGDLDIHATYQPPVFGEQDTDVDLDAYSVTAKGWHFDGWFTAAEGGTQVHSASGEMTVYAHWTAETANYKVAYWQQNANDDGYSLKEVIPAQGTAGTVASFDQSKTYPNFHRNNTLTNAQKELVTIEGDGTTIRNVYFDRDMFTLTFKGGYVVYVRNGRQYSNVSFRDPITDSSYIRELESNRKNISGYDVSYYTTGIWPVYTYNYGIKIDGTWYRIGGAWLSSFTNGDASNVYNASSIVFPGLVKITAKYGEDIGDYFPLIDDGRGAPWQPPANCQTYNYILVYIGTMPAENITFTLENEGTDNPKYIERYVEKSPEDTGTTYNYSGKTFVKYGYTIPAHYNFFTEAEDFIDLTGYDKYVSNPQFGTDGRTTSTSSSYTLRLYYTRHESKLYFVPGDGSDWEETAKYKDPLKPHEPLSGDHQFIKGETTKMVGGKKMIFQGWYDNSDYVGEPFDFNQTMPALDSITLFAKWSEAEYRVELVLNGGTISSGTSFKVDYNGTASLSNPTRTDYEFAGWYTDEACTKRFNENTHLTDATVTDLDYKEGETVRGKLTLYAKWRHVMDAETYLTVSYDANGGTGAPDDDLHYADQAEAIAQPASVPGEYGESFAYWEVMKPTSATDPTLVPTGVQVKPGEIFNVKMDDALNYTVTLRAHYEASKGTHIVWYGNGGTTAEGATEVSSADANLNAAISVKPADTFTRDGYEFLGWARLNESEMKNADGSWKPYTGNELWLTWDGEHYTAKNNHDVTVTNPDIAANEETPFHVLYAVWQKIENYNYVIDFNAKMTVANQTSELRNADKDDVLQGSNGKFVKAGTDVTYQLATGTQHTEANGTTVVNTAYSAADTAIVKGVPVRSRITTPTVSKITTIPASSIYFDDDLVNATVTVGDGSGKNTQIGATPTEDDLAVGKHTYTFYGTGIDVYCTTYKTMNGQNVGTISAKLVKDGKTLYENMYNYSPEIRYNVPTVFFHDLPLGEYTLTLTALSGSHYKLDGIRVYNAVANQALYNETKDEQYAAYVNLRDALVNNPSIETYTVNGSLDAADLTQGTGVLFMDNPEYLTSTVPEIDMKTGEEVKDENGNTKMVKVYTDTFTAYKDLGPKNEIYLDAGQAITFTLTDTAKAGKLWLGLSAPEAGKTTGTVSVNGAAQSIDVTSAMDMYYPITKNDTGSYTIKNEGDDLIAITNLKITGVESIYNVAKAGQQTTQGNEQTGNSSAASFAVEDVVNMVFEPVTLRTVKLAANNGVDPDAVVTPDPEPDPEPGQDPEQPDTPDQPDDPKPGWNDDAYNPINILRTFFKLLLQNLGSLFSGLGNW